MDMEVLHQHSHTYLIFRYDVPMASGVSNIIGWLEALSDWLSDDFILNPLRRTFSETP